MTQKKSSAAFGWSVKNKIGLGRKRRQGETKSKTKLRFWKTQKVLFEEERGSEPVRFVQSWWDRPWDIGKQTLSLYGKKKKKGMIARMGGNGYFSYYTNQRSGLWLWFFSQLIPQVLLSLNFSSLWFAWFLLFIFFFFDLLPKYKMKKDIHQV